MKFSELEGGGGHLLLMTRDAVWWYSLHRSMNGPQSQSGCSGEEKNVSGPAGNRTYVVGSKSYRPDQLFKVTEIKQLRYFLT